MAKDILSQKRFFPVEATELLEPSRYNTCQDKAFLTHYNEMLAELDALRYAESQAFIANVVPYRKGQVLDVDTSWIGRKKVYFKGAQRFLITEFRMFFNYYRNDRTYEKFYINIVGVYLAEDGTVLRPVENPETGEPLGADEYQPEYFSFNVSGDNTRALGISSNSFHKFDELKSQEDE